MATTYENSKTEFIFSKLTAMAVTLVALSLVLRAKGPLYLAVEGRITSAEVLTVPVSRKMLHLLG